MLFGITDPDARFVTAAEFLHPFALELINGEISPGDANRHCSRILAHAEAIERMGRPVPARRPNDGLRDFLKYGQTTIEQIMG